MKPVWIKYYGLIPMTRFGYLVATAVAVQFALLALVVAAVLGGLPPIETMWAPDPAAARLGLGGLFYNYFYWFLLVCLVAEVIDICVTLHTFSKKEAEQLALLAQESEQLADAHPAAPHARRTGVTSPERRVQPDDRRQDFHDDRG